MLPDEERRVVVVGGGRGRSSMGAALVTALSGVPGVNVVESSAPAVYQCREDYSDEVSPRNRRRLAKKNQLKKPRR